jgi:hypothetical protein
MKALFGVVALVIALAVVASIARKQLAATGVAGPAGSPSSISPGGAGRSAVAPTALEPGAGNARQKSATLQEQARERTTQALRQGAERNRQAEP